MWLTYAVVCLPQMTFPWHYSCEPTIADPGMTTTINKNWPANVTSLNLLCNVWVDFFLCEILEAFLLLQSVMVLVVSCFVYSGEPRHCATCLLFRLDQVSFTKSTSSTWLVLCSTLMESCIQTAWSAPTHTRQWSMDLASLVGVRCCSINNYSLWS